MDWSLRQVGADSWNLNVGTGTPIVVVPMVSQFSGGRGCDRTTLAPVQDGRIVAHSADYDWPFTKVSPLPMARPLQELVAGVSRESMVETPVLASNGQTYILFDNIGKFQPVDRVRLLAAF